MVKMMKDKETAQHIDQHDSDLQSETDEFSNTCWNVMTVMNE
jgi:hypothetical protein